MSKIIEENVQKEGEDFMEIKLDDVQFNEFQKLLKCGIYKQLYEKNMLTISQLNQLLNRN